jgi:hypothetical protein
LVWTTRGEASSQYIVPFDRTGQARSHVRVDPEEIFVGGFEVFGSGEFLLEGFRKAGPDDQTRVTIMPAGGGSLHDVIAIPRDPLKEPTAQGKVAALRARGADGLVYFVPAGEDSVHVIEPSGESHVAFTLAKAPHKGELVDLKGAGSRLAAIYYEERPSGNKSGRFWIAVYDSSLGQRVGVYGPVFSPPLCYQFDGRQDEFTVLKDTKYLVKMSR